jgi:hypothetical protein
MLQNFQEWSASSINFRSNINMAIIFFGVGAAVWLFVHVESSAQVDYVAGLLSPHVDVPAKVLQKHLVVIFSSTAKSRSILFSFPWFLTGVIFVMRAFWFKLSRGAIGQDRGA